MILTGKSGSLFLLLVLIQPLINLSPSFDLLGLSPLLLGFLLGKFFILNLSLQSSFLSLLVLSLDFLLLSFDCRHLLSESDYVFVLIVDLGKVIFEDASLEGLLQQGSLVVDFQVDSLGVEFTVLDFVHVQGTVPITFSMASGPAPLAMLSVRLGTTI